MSGPIPPIKVDIVEGQNTAVPALQRTGSEIARVAAGSGAALSPVQRIGKALAISEAREGSVALRAFRTSLDAVLSQATGASTGIARLAQSILGVTGGTGVALAGIGVIAATGLAYRAFTADARDLEEQQKKTAAAMEESNKRIAGVAGQIRTTLSGQGGERPGFLRVLAGEFGLGSGGAHVGEGLNEQLLTQETAVRSFTAQLDRQFGGVANAPDALKAHLHQLTDEATSTAQVIGKLNAALKSATDDVEARAAGTPTREQAHLATVSAIRDARQETEKAALIEQLYARGITDLSSPQALDAFERQKQAWAGVSDAARDATTAAREHLRVIEAFKPSVPGVGPAETREIGGRLLPTVEQSAVTRAQQGGAPAIQRVDEIGRPIVPELPTANASPGLIGITVKGQQTLDEIRNKPPAIDGKEIGRDISSSVAAALALASGIKRGDVGGALTGVGAATSALSQLAPALGPVGVIVSGLGSLANLFSSGKAKVMARIEEESIAKLRDVLQLPQNVSVVVVQGSGDNARDVKYALDRLAAKTGVTTLPGNA